MGRAGCDGPSSSGNAECDGECAGGRDDERSERGGALWYSVDDHARVVVRGMRGRGLRWGGYLRWGR